MIKTRKRTLFIIIAAAVCLFACLSLLAACGGTPDTTKPPADDETVTYAVEVKLADGGAAVGAKVTVSMPGISFGENGTKTVGSDGKATFVLPEGEYDVTLSDLPEHYELPADSQYKLTAENTTLTITLARKFAYVVNLVTEDGAKLNVNGVTVGICTFEGNCLNPVATVNGTAEVEAAKGAYHVKIFGLPAKYAYVCDENDYYTGEDFSTTKTEMTITVYELTAIDKSENLLSVAQKAELADRFAAYDANLQKCDARQFSAELKAGESAYYVFTSEYAGDFKLFSSDNATYSNIGSKFALENGAGTIYGTQAGAKLSVGEDGRNYLRVFNNTDQALTASFVAVFPAASNSIVTGVGNLTGKTTAEVTIEVAGACAVIQFRPTVPGAYKITTLGDAPAFVSVATVLPDAFGAYDQNASFAANATESIKLLSAYSEGTASSAYFAVSIPSTNTYPISFKVEIEKLNDITNTTTIVEVTETLSQYTAPDGKELAPIAMDGSAEFVYNNTDKFYHLGTENGPVVVVNLTGDIDQSRFSFGYALAYLDMETRANISYVLDVTSDADKADLTKGNTYKDYRKFIRGFDEYKLTEGMQGYVPSIPDTITTQTYYAKYVDENGVYPLTEELKTFIQDMCSTYAADYFGKLSFFLPEDVEPENFWLFPLYYYDDAVEADAICNTYYSADGHYTLFVGKRNTYSLFDNYADSAAAYLIGTWTKINDGYTFTYSIENVELNYSNGIFTFIDSVLDPPTTVTLTTTPPADVEA